MRENLFSDIITILNEEGLKLSTKSNRMMERLRCEYVFLRNLYFHSFNYSPTVTIDPESHSVKFELGEKDLVEDYVKIYAYSFGPFNPEEYFKEDTFRILWLLKEPYMQSGDLDQYKSGKYRYLGGFNQAAEYAHYFKEHRKFGNPTLDNLLKITRKVLLSSEKIDLNASDEEVMKHICILEANHFPGLAFNSTDSDNTKINNWMSRNESYLSKLIHFYVPDLVILGGKNAMYSIIHCKDNNKEYNDDDFFNWIRVSKLEDYQDSKYSIFDRKLLPNSDNKKVLDLENLKEDIQRAAIFQDEKGTIWFPWYHTSPRPFNTYWNSKWKSEDKNALEEITKFIKKYVMSNKNTVIK